MRLLVRVNVQRDALLAGIAYVRREKIILGAITLDLFAVFFGGITALLPIFAKDILKVGPAERVLSDRPRPSEQG